MKCPACGYPESKVTDSRPTEEGVSIRRRRQCLSCGKRFTTYEIIDTVVPVVLKKNGTREYFDRNKLLVGLLKACEKRPVDARKIAEEIESEISNSLRTEITSAEIGELAMERLRTADAVAYVRFASVHREFKDVDSFVKEIAHMKDEDSTLK